MKLFSVLALTAAVSGDLCSHPNKKARAVLEKDSRDNLQADSYNCGSVEEAQTLYDEMAQTSEANKYVTSVSFYQCRKQKNKDADSEGEGVESLERGNRQKKQKVFVSITCADGSSLGTKLKGCDIQKARRVKKRCKPKQEKEGKDKEEKVPRDCDSLATLQKVNNCRANQGLEVLSEMPNQA